MSISRTRALALNLALLIASLVLALGILELALRVQGRIVGNAASMRLLEEAPDRPCAVIPNLHLTTVIDDEEVVIETNGRGMRWREVETERSPGTRRVAFTGDSFTFGEWAPTAETGFVGVVDSRLRAQGFDVLNFGVPGDGPPEIEERLTRILSFEPDYVVLNLYNGNDLSDSYLGARKTDCSSGRLVRGLARERVPREFREPWSDAFKTALNDQFRLVRALRTVKGRLTGDVRFAQSGDEGIADASFTVEDRFFAAGFWSREDYPPVALEAMEKMLESLTRIDEVAESRGSQLILTAIPYREQVYTSVLRGDGYDLALPQRHFAEFARERDIPYYDLLPDLRAHVDACGSMLYVRSDPHFNRTGHRVAGELIAQFLRDVLDLDEQEAPPPACGEG